MANIDTGRKSRAGKPLPDVPDKLYFRIGEVARLLALPAYVLRFWETEFPQLKPGKGSTGQRLYRRRDLDTLLEIRHLLYDQGYTIPGARQHLKDHAPAKDAGVPEVCAPESPILIRATADTRVASDPVVANEPAGDYAESTDAVAVLLRMQTELRKIAGLLAQPSADVLPGNPAHRGLHLAARGRGTPDDLPTLFALPQAEDDPEE
ncbi:MAG: MerR family transcriptional regulator [Janthinobacterium lividum]